LRRCLRWCWQGQQPAAATLQRQPRPARLRFVRLAAGLACCLIGCGVKDHATRVPLVGLWHGPAACRRPGKCVRTRPQRGQPLPGPACEKAVPRQLWSAPLDWVRANHGGGVCHSVGTYVVSRASQPAAAAVVRGRKPSACNPCRRWLTTRLWPAMKELEAGSGPPTHRSCIY
jgi:hypothetical protein